MKLTSATRLSGNLTLNGDKSISHRVGMIASLANGTTQVENFSSSADCASTLACMRELGVKIERDGSNVTIHGVGKYGLREPQNALDCGNSGSTMRMLAGILAGQNFASKLIGDESLSKRPMKRIISPLAEMNAEIEAENGCSPLNISGTNALQSISYTLPVASAQVKSCVLLAGLFANGKTEVIESELTRNHTEKMLRYFGAELEESFDANLHKVSVSGNSELTAKDFSVPSDVSSSAFFLVGASCLEGSNLRINNVGLNSTRGAIIEVLQGFGANITIENSREVCNEPVGDLRIIGSANLTPKEGFSNIVRGKIISNLIDELPVLAVFGTQLKHGLEVRDAKELRVKESDRIRAVVENLRRMNADVEEFEDGFRVGKSDLQGAKLDAFDDHRIAMAFAIAALFANGETEIIGAECAGVSFPEFYEKLDSIKK